MSISQRLLLTLAVALLGLFAVGSYGLLQLHRANERFDYLQVNTFPSIHTLDQALQAQTDMRVLTYRHGISEDPKVKADIEASIAEALRRAGLSAEDINTVFLTGGSCGVPAVRAAIARAAPAARTVAGDAFGSVATGLALDAGRRFGQG